MLSVDLSTEQWDGTLYAGRVKFLPQILEMMQVVALQSTETLYSLAQDLFSEAEIEIGAIDLDGFRGFIIDVINELESEGLESLLLSMRSASIEQTAAANPQWSRAEVLTAVQNTLLNIIQGECTRDNPEVFAGALYWYLSDASVSNDPLHIMQVFSGAMLVNYYEDGEEIDDEDIALPDEPFPWLN